MTFRNKCFIAAQTLGAAFIVAILVVACGGGGTSGFAQSYTASAGAGDVMQFSIDTANMTYSFKVVETSYAASGVSPTESSAGTLAGRNAIGSYYLSRSADGFVLGGEVYPLQNGMFVGHVLIPKIGGAIVKIPVFGVPNPITTVANLAATYNYQGFACNFRSGGNVTAGAYGCTSHTGTIQITDTGAFTTCRGDNLGGTTTPVCTLPGGGTAASTFTGTIIPTATPGVFDFRTSDGYHRGWFFAFSTGGQNVAVIDHDDYNTPEIFGFGHTVAVSQTSVSPGQIDGKYFVKNDLGQRHLITVSGLSFSDTYFPNSTGTLLYNQPWTGLVSYQMNWTVPDSGVADIATAGAFTYNSHNYPYLFGVGLKY
ncbi:MAG: hypothetical protein WCA64_04060 [Gallionella sp.]